MDGPVASSSTGLLLPFKTVDVFTTTKFQGNPLAIVTIPADVCLTQEQKRLIAREFNLSETVFVQDIVTTTTTTPQSRVEVGIFVHTGDEIPFAGHPVIGAAATLIPQGVRELVTRAGPVSVARGPAPGSVSASIPHNVRVHQKRLADVVPSPSLHHDDDYGLQQVPALRERELAAPVVSIVRGMTFLLVELPSLEALGQVQKTGATFPVEQLLDDGWRCGLVARLYFVRMGDDKTGYGDGVATTTTTTPPPPPPPAVKIRTRMMEYFLEDPATGSAACCLSSFLSLQDQDRVSPVRNYEITQGVEMGRESNIMVKVQMDLDSNTIQSVHLAGQAVQVMHGHIPL
ncbi:Phenazine biosynthesis PhzC/PhzF protein [Moelleriella libera RCEF 2490]|uniref:Phenazine biosynthesis PhzC/PhzF protein n=1 Tax=Moelleriella libera RCEF 2490 TaxID=1081109 RepID=A0A168D9V0_9HYPO|nr:Phenazine biosynthesis PhzC/PhzF protein [Moelleriella libera RCEF 2490]